MELMLWLIRGDNLRVVAGITMHKSCWKNYIRDTSSLTPVNESESRHCTIDNRRI